MEKETFLVTETYLLANPELKEKGIEVGDYLDHEGNKVEE